VESTKRNIHRELPRLWQALKARSNLSVNHGVYQAAGQYLISMMGTLDPDARKYAEGLIARMVEAEYQGRNLLEVIPGHSSLKAAVPLCADMPVDMARHEAVHPQPGTYAPATSPWASSPLQLQSSPLPEWMGF
jgi:hypothetical protein